MHTSPLFAFRKATLSTLLRSAAAVALLMAGGFFLHGTAYAANECGAAVAGDTVTCNGDGNPATDVPNSTGINYAVPVTLNVDGTNTPLAYNGPITINSAAGPQVYNLTGDITMTRVGNVGLFTLGNYSFQARDITINTGSGVSIDLNRTVANGNMYAIAAGASNGAIAVNSAADLTLQHQAGGASTFLAGITAYSTTGGANSTVNVNNTGNINMIMGAGYYAYLIYGASIGTGSTSLVDVQNSGNLRLDQAGAITGCIGVTAANTGTGGAAVSHNGGTLVIEGDCGSSATALYADAGQGDATINVNSTIDVTTTAGAAVGLYAAANAGTAILNINADITVDSANALGTWLGAPTQFYDINVADNVNVLAHGAGSTAIYAVSVNGGTIDIGTGAVISGDNGAGYAIWTGGSNGADIITSRGELLGDIGTGAGNDEIHLLGGSVTGGIDMDDGDDLVSIDGLTDITGMTHLLGGNGTDELTFDGVTHGGASLAADDPALGINLGDGWETINLRNTRWTLTGNLMLGGSTVDIDSSSTLYAGNGLNPTIASVIPGDPALVNNAGVIDLTNGPFSATDTLTIFGNYVGNNGILLVDLSAAGGTATADQLIIDGSNGGGSATGTTMIRISGNSLGGPTTGNGILVASAINGATIGANAFTLSPAHAMAGAYRYNLNTVSGDYYLSSLLRNEVPVDMALSGMAYQYGIGMLGTKDQRMPVDNPAYRNYAFWMRSFAEKGDIGNDGDFAAHGPDYDYDMAGMQLGLDLYREEATANNGAHSTGIYVGAATMGADVRQAGGAALAGTADMNGYSLGAYWTYRGAGDRWYVDNVVQGTYYSDAKTMSVNGEGISTEGTGIAASTEAGINMRLNDTLILTPQAQLAYQAVWLNDASNAAGTVSHDTTRAVSARLGAKLSHGWRGEDDSSTAVWMTPNIWHRFADNSETRFTPAGGGTAAFESDLGGTWGQIELGVSHNMTQNVSFFAAGNYGVSLDRDGSSLAGRAGFKVTW